MKSISIINGPNLNLLGEREVQIYGTLTHEQLTEEIVAKFAGHDIRVFQSNHEGEIIDAIHESRKWAQALIINGAALSHSSFAIFDAIKSVNLPCIEVHLSNVYAREQFRHQSAIAPACIGQISGLGKQSYFLAVEYFVNLPNAP